MLPALIPLGLKLFASKWAKYALLILAAFTGYEIWKATLRAAGAEKERQLYRKRADEIREGMIRAPQHNEEGTADELENNRY